MEIDDGPMFLLAGNGPYENRGCEAIVRGTTRILRKHFDDPRFICLSHFNDQAQFERQRDGETDRDITHIHSYSLRRRDIPHKIWKPFYMAYLLEHILRPERVKYRVYRDMLPLIDGAEAVLSVGGDNYSLDYGVPKRFVDLDDIVMERGGRMFIWGASVGPFSSMPDYERYMADHLADLDGIFARESATTEYLQSIGVSSNVHSVVDPAFVMEPVEPRGFDLPLDKDAIGLNLSPLMARYVTGGDMERWREIASGIIRELAERTEMTVYLISHVTIPTANDHEFMRSALSSLENSRNVHLLPPQYSAAETKWIISRMSLFCGARTHSTIAALSSGVPTLSLAYSIKARGINEDIFGDTSFMIDPSDLTPGNVVDNVEIILNQKKEICHRLEARTPELKASAMNAGKILRALLDDREDV